MPRRSNAFQQVVLLLHERLSGEASVTESKELPDTRTGNSREVDVVIEISAAGYPVVLSIECVDRTRPATVEWVEQMWAKHADLPTNKLVLISKSGFTQEAQSKARALEVTALALEEVATIDWTQIVGKLASVYVETLDSHYQAFALVMKEGSELEQIPAPFGTQLHTQDRSTFVFVGALIEQVISSPDVGRVFLDHMTKESKAENVFTVEREFGEPLLILESDPHPLRVKALRIVFTAKRLHTPVPLVHGAMRGAALAYGEGASATGELRVAVVEKEGQWAAVEIRKREGTNWRKLINVDER
jgi:hypothetical protein